MARQADLRGAGGCRSRARKRENRPSESRTISSLWSSSSRLHSSPACSADRQRSARMRASLMASPKPARSHRAHASSTTRTRRSAPVSVDNGAGPARPSTRLARNTATSPRRGRAALHCAPSGRDTARASISRRSSTTCAPAPLSSHTRRPTRTSASRRSGSATANTSRGTGMVASGPGAGRSRSAASTHMSAASSEPSSCSHRSRRSTRSTDSGPRLSTAGSRARTACPSSASTSFSARIRPWHLTLSTSLDACSTSRRPPEGEMDRASRQNVSSGISGRHISSQLAIVSDGCAAPLHRRRPATATTTAPPAGSSALPGVVGPQP